jgi:hypothetical protein
VFLSVPSRNAPQASGAGTHLSLCVIPVFTRFSVVVWLLCTASRPRLPEDLRFTAAQKGLRSTHSNFLASFSVQAQCHISPVPEISGLSWVYTAFALLADRLAYSKPEISPKNNNYL